MNERTEEKCIIRPAIPHEAPLLGELAVRSKAHWGYSPEFIESCREELSYSPKQLESSRYVFAVAEIGRELVGFCGLALLTTSNCELEALFVKPSWIGKGVGQTLLEHAKRTAADLKYRTITIVSDPHAAAFYKAAGAEQTGSRESGSIPGRVLPVFSITSG